MNNIDFFLNKKNYNELINFYGSKIENNNQEYDNYVYLGLAYLLNDDHIEAEATWFYLLTEESNNAVNLLIKVLDQATVKFIKNNQLDQAIIIYQNLKLIEPNYNQLHLESNSIIQQWLNNALNLTTNKFIEEAINQYQLILKFSDHDDEIWQKLSLNYYYINEYQSAYQCILKAIEIDQKNFIYFYHGAIFLEKLNYLEKAIEFYQKSISINPKYIDTYNNLGNLFLQIGNISKALENYHKAIKINEQHFGTNLNLGNLYLKLNQPNLALAYYSQSLETNPNYDTFLWIVNNIRSFNYIQESINFSRNNCHLLTNNLFAQIEHNRHLPFIYENKQKINYYRDNLTNFLQEISKIDLYTKNNQLWALNLVDYHSNYHLHYQAKNDLPQQSLYGNFIHQVMKANYPDYCQPIISVKNEHKIKIGYISYCLKSHVVGKLSLGWIKYHNSDLFEIYCYYLGDSPEDKITREFRKHCDYFYHFSDNLSLVDIAQKIKNNQLNILVFIDLGMYPRMSQLAGFKLAPIQFVTWLHPITSGIPTIDYFISSELIEKENSYHHYSENLITLPNLGVVYPKRELASLTKNKNKFGLAQSKITYISSQFCSKYLPQYDYIYPEIAKIVKNCQFVFIHPRINENNDKITQQLWSRIKQSFSNYQLNWQDYCQFLPTLTKSEDYWQLMNSCDIFLDTIGFTGFNSTVDAIECFLPVVTYSGEFFRTRQSEGILKMIQVTDTVADSIDNYLDIAIKLGNNYQWRQNISDKIKQNIHLIYDDLTPVHYLEKYYLDFCS